jgi:uncharacterized protein (TIGR03435 family)
MTELSLVAKATAILGLALVVTHTARGGPASVRALILATTFGLLLVLPIASAVAPPQELEIPEAYSPAFLEEEPVPAVPLDVGAAPNAAAQTSQSWRVPSVISVARGIWVLGFFAMLAPLLLGMRRSRAIQRDAHEWAEGAVLASTLRNSIGLRRPVSVLLHDDLVSPMTCGWRQPAIVMPADSPAWPPADVRQALLHELEHVRRRDWPVHILARFTCALYWFHPGAWMAWRQLALESERACDDAVVALAERTAYAEQLVSLARRLAKHGPMPLLSMADRRTLSARVASILSTSIARGRVGTVVMAAVLTGAAVLVVTIAPIQARTSPQTPDSDSRTIDPALRFGVVSVRPNDGSDPSRGFGFTLESGRLRLRNQTLRTMISVAYSQPFGLFFPDERISGGPAWMNSDRFTIEARAERAVTAREMGAMLRALLADRFNLTVSVETKQAPIYALIFSKKDGSLGPSLKRTEVECGVGAGRCGIGGGQGRYQLAAASMPLLAASLSELVARPIVDRTGLTGSFDGTLTWAPAPEELGALGEPAPAAPQFGASLFTALEEQFGLKLQSERGGVEYLIVTNADQPTPNDAPGDRANAAAQSATPPRPAFEVASIRRNTSGAHGQTVALQGNTFVGRNVTARELVMTAFHVRSEDLSGGPGWIDTERYDVSGRPQSEATWEETLLMLQRLLADRFKLAVRRDSRQSPAYALVVGRSGSKLTPAANPGCTASPPGGKCGGFATRPGFFDGRRVTVAQVASLLSGRSGRLVVDRTGISGFFDVTLSWTPDANQLPPGPPPDGVPPFDPSGPSLFAAIQEQLGLRLEPTTAETDHFVIERIERPTPNDAPGGN